MVRSASEQKKLEVFALGKKTRRQKFIKVLIKNRVEIIKTVL